MASDSNARWGVPVNQTGLIAPVEKTQQSSSPSVLLSSAALVGSLVEGACAILVASASAKLLLGLGAVAGAVKASRLHADIVRIPVLLVSAVVALITLLVLWNAWRARSRSAARWRKRPMTVRDKFSFAVTLLASVMTLALVVGEAIEHPIFHIH
jgi:fumarate reductase subunit C